MSNFKYTDDQLAQAVKEATNYSQVQRILSSGKSGSVYMHLKKRIVSLNLDTSHFNSYASNRYKGVEKILFTDVLVCRADRTREKSTKLRKAMLQHGFEYRCAVCKLSEWLDNTITLEIDHIDGINYNNVPSNLRFLCPNCHAQTSTYGYKGKHMAYSSIG